MDEIWIPFPMKKRKLIRHLRSAIDALQSRNQIISVQAGLYSEYGLNQPSTKNAHKEFTRNLETIDLFEDILEFVQEPDLNPSPTAGKNP